MGKKRKELSHAEIWDDSGLIDSWNESYEEYKKYHSVHARGENVKDIIAEAEAADRQEEDTKQKSAVDSLKQQTQTEASNNEVLEDGELPDDDAPMAEDTLQAVGVSEVPAVPNSQTHNQPEGPNSSDLLYNVAEGSSQNPALKNLMMSWYWAGYYTGYYEGQNSANSGQAGGALGNNAPSSLAK